MLVADLGMDKVMIYELDGDKGRLNPASTPWVESAPGAGPRHVDFHPDGRYVCVLNEIDMTLSSYAYDADSGGMTSRSRPYRRCRGRSPKTLPPPTCTSRLTGALSTARIGAITAWRYLHLTTRAEK